MKSRRATMEPISVRRQYPGADIKQYEPFFWIGPRTGADESFFKAGGLFTFGLKVDWPGGEDEWVVCAGQEYELLLNGERIGMGPDSLLPGLYRYESRRVSLPPGRHVLAARVWWAPPDFGRFDRDSGRVSFMLGSLKHPALCSTGIARWKVRQHPEAAVGPLPLLEAFAVGGSWTHDYLSHPNPGKWSPAVTIGPVRCDQAYGEFLQSPPLAPTRLPEQHRQTGNELRPCWRGSCEEPVVIHLANTDESSIALPLKLPAQSGTRLLFSLDHYRCARPSLRVRGGKGTVITLEWAESLVLPDGGKGRRDDWKEKAFVGYGDTWILDGRTRTLGSLPWRAGRYLLLTIKTARQGLTIDGLQLEDSSYPMTKKLQWSADISGENEILKLCWNGLKANAHETLTDCPYYERLMYVGDARIQSLCHLLACGSRELVLQSVETFEAARGYMPMIPSRAGAKSPQLIPGFSMIWILWLRDIHRWLGEEKWLHKRLPAMRQVINFLEQHERADGLLKALPGWLFMDWAPGWQRGVPPHAGDLAPCALQMLYVMALDAAAALEKSLGLSGLAGDLHKKRGNVLRALRMMFWDEESQFWLEKPAVRASASQHAQVLSVLSGATKPTRSKALLKAALRDRSITPCSFAFQFYLFDALHTAGLAGEIPDLLGAWRSMLDLGLFTPLEEPEPSRSDCHAWSSHPLYHLPASILGLRPASPGCKDIRIAPQPGTLPKIVASVTLPTGKLTVNLRFSEGSARGLITLPNSSHGTFLWRSTTRNLSPGKNRISIP